MKPTFENILFLGSLKDSDNIVIIVDTGAVYSTHKRRAEAWKLDKYIMGGSPQNGLVAVIIRSGEINSSRYGYAIDDGKQQYIIGERGVKKISFVEVILKLEI